MRNEIVASYFPTARHVIDRDARARGVARRRRSLGAPAQRQRAQLGHPARLDRHSARTSLGSQHRARRTHACGRQLHQPARRVDDGSVRPGRRLLLFSYGYGAHWTALRIGGMTMSARTILLTGATGLLGRDVLADCSPPTLVRRASSCSCATSTAGASQPARVAGRDESTGRAAISAPAVGLTRGRVAQFAATVTAIVHLAADTTFSRRSTQARAVNTEGTRRVFELAPTGIAHARGVRQHGVRGRQADRRDRRARHRASTPGGRTRYEQSKYEAEALVRAYAGATGPFSGRHRRLRRRRTAASASSTPCIARFTCIATDSRR